MGGHYLFDDDQVGRATYEVANVLIAMEQLAITTLSRKNVLLVPVTALLARPGGGYQVRLASGGNVAVTPGLFDSTNGTVEVTGQVSVGQQVEVPAP